MWCGAFEKHKKAGGREEMVALVRSRKGDAMLEMHKSPEGRTLCGDVETKRL